MAIPGFESFMLPLLKIAGDGKVHSIAESRELLATKFNLTPEERRQLQPSGYTRLFDNGVNWARTDLVKAGLLEAVSLGRFRISRRGMDLLEERPDAIDQQFLLRYPEFRRFAGKESPKDPTATENAAFDEAFVFPLEKFLEEFLVANWDKTIFGKRLALYTEDDEPATQYVTDVGVIDILARDKSTNDWVVIELKKGKPSDGVLGQLLRYMGWVKKHKAGAGEGVEGIIVGSAPDDKIKYAMLVNDGISFYTYKVRFDLMEEKHA
jgi:restriction endonuclease Mrr